MQPKAIAFPTDAKLVHAAMMTGRYPFQISSKPDDHRIYRFVRTRNTIPIVSGYHGPHP